MNAAAFSALLALVAIGWIYRDPPDQASAAPGKFGVYLSKREWVLASLAGAIWGTYNVGYIVLVSFAPEFFTARGYSLERASSIVSLVGWLLIPSVPVSGYLVERLRRPDMLVFAGLGTVTIALAALPSVSAPAALFFFIALLIGIPAGLMMALPANVLRSESVAAGMGVFYVWYYAEMTVLPGVAGATRDLSGAAAAPILFAAAMMALASICLAGFRLATRASSSSQET